MTGAILSVFMTMVCECLVLAHRNHVRSAQKLNDLRTSTALLDRVSRELRGCTLLYHPDASLPPISTYGSYSPTADWLVFRTTGAAGPKVVGYHLDDLSHTLTRVLYRNDYDPTDPATQVVTETHMAGQNNQAFNVSQIDPSFTNGAMFMKVNIQLYSESEPISVEVRVKNL